MLFSVDIPFMHVLLCPLLFVGCVWFSVSASELPWLLPRTVLSLVARGQLSFCKKFICYSGWIPL